MKRVVTHFLHKFGLLLTNDKKRIIIQMIVLPAILGLTSLVMCILNIIQGVSNLAWATGAFFGACLLIFVLMLCSKKLLYFCELLFAIALITLFTYFVIFGGIDGFSTNWIR